MKYLEIFLHIFYHKMNPGYSNFTSFICRACTKTMMTHTAMRVAIFVLLTAQLALGLAPEVSRSQFWKQSLSATVVVAGTILPNQKPVFAVADKLVNLPDEKLKAIIKKDILEKQFLATGQLTREIYDESAKFTDEIDTYELDKWIKGTQKLFRGDKSSVRLVGDINVSKNQIDFLFDEDLMFNIPFQPTVSLTGKVVLTRDTSTGLITSYQEFWDQDVVTVLKSAKF